MSLLIPKSFPAETAAALEPRTARLTRYAPLALVAAIAIATALVHLALGGRYDAMRNELYFIVCGRRPDFGYVDQPPLAPLIAAATQLFGVNVWLMRLPGAIAATALVVVSAALAKLLNGRSVAMALAAASAALSPALAGIAALITPFDLRASRLDRDRLLRRPHGRARRAAPADLSRCHRGPRARDQVRRRVLAFTACRRPSLYRKPQALRRARVLARRSARGRDRRAEF